MRNELDNALKSVISLYNSGYSSLDIITTLFKVLKYHDSVPEYLRLEFIRVRLFTKKKKKKKRLTSKGSKGNRSDACAHPQRCQQLVSTHWSHRQTVSHRRCLCSPEIKIPSKRNIDVVFAIKEKKKGTRRRSREKISR